MATAPPPPPPITLETVIRWAKSGHESDKVYRFLFLHPDDFFTIPHPRAWPIAHQIIFNGDVTLLRSVLALFYDDQIDIRTLSADGKTLLDVANERRQHHEEMYKYIQELFLSDDLIQAAKKNDWALVRKILEEHPHLANEKPPYSTFFLLHYMVQNGDKKILEDLFSRFTFDTNVFSADLETPLDLARRLKRNDLCAMLELTTSERSNSDVIKYRTLTPATAESIVSSGLPYPKVDPFPSPSFKSYSIVLTEAGNYQLQNTSPFSLISSEPPKTEQTDHLLLPPNSESLSTTPITPTSKAQLMKNLTCPLTQKIFVDPVVACDGQTYERSAITEWVEKYECSPSTGTIMDATFTDNIEVRQIIQSMRK